ncbi:MAG: hypothetical protein ACTSPD_14595 [Promethearchaeota archaeon]
MPERREIYYRLISKIFPSIVITDSLNGKITIEQTYIEKENKIRIEIDIIQDLIDILLEIRNKRQKNRYKELKQI